MRQRGWLVGAWLLVWLGAGCASPFAFEPCRTPPDGPLSRVPVVRQDTPAWCGPACLEMVGRYWGLDWTRGQVARDLGMTTDPPSGVGMLVMRDWMRDHGMQAFAFSGTMDRLARHTSRGRPVIVGLDVIRATAHPATWNAPELKHFVVVLQVRADRVVCIDPMQGLVQAPTERFDAHWAACSRAMLVAAPRNP